MNATDIREHMPIVCSDHKRFATADRVEGGAIKVTKDEHGRHHYIPMSWVTHVDDEVHVDRPGAQAMREWLDAPPKAA
jgi:hypothetical protein